MSFRPHTPEEKAELETKIAAVGEEINQKENLSSSVEK